MLRALLLFSLVGLALGGFLFSCTGSNGVESADPAVAAPSEDADGVITVGAIRLWRDYDANAVAADNIYKDRTLRVTGRVLAIERPFSELVMLTIAGGNPVFHTMAALDTSETQKAAVLAKGDMVTLQCIGEGAMMRMPQLKDCLYLGKIAAPPR